MWCEAVKLVKTGRRVTLGRPLDTVRRPRQRPPGSALHDAYGRQESRRADLLHRLHRGRLPRQVGQPHGRAGPHRLQGPALQRQAGWRRGGFHGFVVCPRSPVWRRAWWPEASSWTPARARGVDWVEPPAALGPSDLEDIAASLGVEVRRGDAVLLRSGQMRPSPRPGPLGP